MKTFKPYSSITAHIFLFLLLCFLPQASYAYIVPSYFIANRLAKQNEALEQTVIFVEILRQNPDDTSETKTLWSGTIFYDPHKINSDQYKTSWPLLPTLFSASSDIIFNSWKAFGLKVSREEELIAWSPEELQKNPSQLPSPYYRRDQNVHLRRFNNKIAWSISNTEKDKNIYIQKDAFVFLGMQGPCPESLVSSGWFTSEVSDCSLLVKHYNSKSGVSIPSLISIKIGTAEKYLIKFHRVLTNPSLKIIQDLKQKKNTVPANDELITTIIHYFLV